MASTTLYDDYKPMPIVDNVRQSPPVDLSQSYDPNWLKGKTIVITGGASGFGAGYASRWASHGATVIIGDINASLANDLVTRIRSETSNPTSAYFVLCNVTSWESQVAFFKEAVKASPHGGIDMVVANAGIAGHDNFELPQNLDKDAPPPPNLKTIEVNLIGVLYTVHLAIFWLQRNPQSPMCNPKTDPMTQTRDRHLLLMGSMASLSPIPAQPLYGTSKHAVLGLFRTLRSTAWVHGIRVNMLCPYFIDTPIVPAPVRLLLAGGALGKPEDVVEAATRLTADSRIVGRSLYVGPKMNVKQNADGIYQLVVQPQRSKVALGSERQGEIKAIWEAFAEDFEDSELFGRNLTRLLNEVTRLRGYWGYWVDIFSAIKYGVKAGPKRLFGTM